MHNLSGEANFDNNSMQLSTTNHVLRMLDEITKMPNMSVLYGERVNFVNIIQYNHDIIEHYITLHHITLHHITLHYITLHYITLHCITLHYINIVLQIIVY